MNEYIRVGNRTLRLGITTGGCAALATKAAVRYMLEGSCPDEVSFVMGNGMEVTEPVFESGSDDGAFYAAIKKDAGDDPDVTDGMLIFAKVSEAEGNGVTIDGGVGVGRVTKPGLDQPVGNAAINSGPRALIERAALEAYEECGRSADEAGLSIEIYVPGGDEVAKKTFNPNLGIEGGISILGTTGIEEPMSEKAMIDSIRLEIKQARLESERLILTPGNYGYNMTRDLGLIDVEVPVVLYSGFLGVALDAAAENEFKEVLLISHIGKLVKTAGGIMNTHQREADCRRELITAHAAAEGAGTDMCKRLMEVATTDAAIEILDEATGLRERVMKRVMDAVMWYMGRRTEDAYHLESVMFSNQYGILEKSEGADDMIAKWRGDIG